MHAKSICCMDMYPEKGAQINWRTATRLEQNNELAFKEFKRQAQTHIRRKKWECFSGDAIQQLLTLSYREFIERMDADQQFANTILLEVAQHYGKVTNARLIVLNAIEHGADINIRTAAAGETPLMLAAQNGNRTIVELLLQQGANMHARTTQGKTALDLARDKRDMAIVRSLERYSRRNGAKQAATTADAD